MSLIGLQGDLHFGASYNLGTLDPKTQHNTRLLDYMTTLKRNIDLFIENGIDLLVFLGDIYETRSPSQQQINALVECLNYALDKGLKVIILAGNHDQQRSTDTTTIDLFKTLRLKNVSVYTDFGVYDYNGVKIFLMPYRDRKYLGVETNKEAVEIINKKLTDLGYYDCENKVVFGHYMFEGTTSYSKSETFSMTEILLDRKMFRDAKAVVMGHIHRAEILSNNPPMFYSGSMERNTYGEKDYDKCIVFVDTNDYSASKLMKVDVKDLYDLKIDYSDSFLLKGETLPTLLKDIDAFCERNNVKNSIMRLSAKIDETDLYSVNQNAIKSYLYSKGICYCSGVSITSFFRYVRKTDLIDTTDSKKIIEVYIKELDEIEATKKDMLQLANDIISSLDGVSNASDKTSIK